MPRQRSKKVVKKKQIKTKITDLNTECYVEICRNLKWKDLLNLKLSHDAFGDAVDFIVRIREFPLVMMTNVEANSPEFEGFLELFGRKIFFLDIYFSVCCESLRGRGRSIDVDNRVESLIVTNCLDGNIRHCDFGELRLSKSFFTKKRSISFLNSLETLSWSYPTDQIHLTWLTKFLSASKSIRELNIRFGKTYSIALLCLTWKFAHYASPKIQI